MPALLVFLLKVNVALIIFCLGYFLVLRRLTFYSLNRMYLVAVIIFSSVYPLINLDAFADRHRQFTGPVQIAIMNLKAPAANMVKPLIEQPTYWHWLELVFWAGAALLALRLSVQFISLYRLHKSSAADVIKGHAVQVISKNISPFSFWQSIYINPVNLKPTDLDSILQHEQIHIKEWHTLDVLLTEISTIFYWFNPGIWLIRKAVRENLEFITDRKVLQKGADSKLYQYSLLNVSFTSTQSAGIANHFNISTLKKRIMMMNKKQSSNFNLTRYAFLVPVVIVCLFAFSLSKAEIVKQSKNAYKAIAATVTYKKQVPIDTVEKTIISRSLPAGKITINNKFEATYGIVVTDGLIDTGRKANFKIKSLAIPDTYTGKKITYYTERGIDNINNDLQGNYKAGSLALSDNYKTDISKKNTTITSPDNNLNYVVDGVKITDASEIPDANSVKNSYNLSAESAASLSYKFENKYGSDQIIFVFTKSATPAANALEKKIREFYPDNKAIIKPGTTNNLLADFFKNNGYIIAISRNFNTDNNKDKVQAFSVDSIVNRGDITYLYGKARLLCNDQIIEADYIEYNDKTRKGFAKGKVIVTSKKGNVKATTSDLAFSLED